MYVENNKNPTKKDFFYTTYDQNLLRTNTSYVLLWNILWAMMTAQIMMPRLKQHR